MKNLLLLFVLGLVVSPIYAQWEQLNDIPFVKHHSNGFGFNGKAYILEGTGDDDNLSNELWQYDPISDNWDRLQDFPGPGRSISIGDDMDDKYYFGFGGGENGALNDLWEYDPETNTFKELASCPCIGRSHPAFVAHEGKIYMGSGSSSNGDLRDWWIYDLATDEWTEGPDIPGENRHHPFQFGIDDGIFVGGGHRSNWSRYDINDGTWTAINDFPGGRVAGTQFSFEGKGYVLSGDAADHGPIAENVFFLQYDPETDEWIELPPHPELNRWACSSFIIDDYLYLFGGYMYSETEPFNDAAVWRFNMRKLDCLPPALLNAVNVTDTSAGLFWYSNGNSLSDTLQYRTVGNSDWVTATDVSPVYSIDELEACQEYEFRVISNCDTIASDHSNLFQFTTDGCCLIPELSFNNLSEQSIDISWPSILAANVYEIRWRAITDQEWNNEMTNDPLFNLSNLTECTEYEIQIKSVCDIEDIDFGASQFFVTKGCGVCLDVDYCAVSTTYNGSFFHIEKINIEGFENTSGNNNGYGNFASPNSLELLIGENYTIQVSPGFESDETFINYSIWIDWNGNGNFQPTEKVIYEDFIDDDLIETFTIPTSAKPGLTRMRIIAGWDDIIGPCAATDYLVGEVEDYCLILKTTSSVIDADNPIKYGMITPTPFNDQISFQYSLDQMQNVEMEIIDGIGRIVFSKKMTLASGEHTIQITPTDIPNGICIFRLKDQNGLVLFTQKTVSIDQD